MGRQDLLTFRRGVLVSLSLLTLFLFFGGSAYKSPEQRRLESRIEQVWKNTEFALKELQSSSDTRDRQAEHDIKQLRLEKQILERQLQELRRLPEPAGVLEQLKFQFPYRVDSRFPAYIWQTWKVDKDDQALDPEIREYMDSWSHLNPDFVHEVFSDDTALRIVRHLYMNIPKVVEAYESMPEVILKADFFRYLILLARGGTYSDADTEALKPVPNWMPQNVNPLEVGLIIGIEADPDRPDWADWFARRIQFCQWTIESKPGHPVLRNIVANITDITLRRKEAKKLYLPTGSERGSTIMDWTGPGIFTDAVFQYLNNTVASQGLEVTWHNFTHLEEPKKIADVLTLPITSFSPGVNHMGSKPISDSMAFVQHKFGGSWKPESERVV